MEPPAPLVLGTRGSELALAQAKWVAVHLQERGVEVRLEIVSTQGDRLKESSFDELQGKGFFTKEIEEALLERRIDVAVHSLKDLPTVVPPGLVVAAIPEREDPRDCLVMRRHAYDPEEPALPVKRGATIGTSAVRRKSQVLTLRADLVPVDLRGNVPTRIRRLSEGRCDALLLACAGLRRLGFDLSSFVTVSLDPELFVPAPAQGALAVQVRHGSDGGAADRQIVAVVSALQHEATARQVTCERALLARLEGGCHLPLGAYAQACGDDGALKLVAFMGTSLTPGAGKRVACRGTDPHDVAARAFEELGGV